MTFLIVSHYQVYGEVFLFSLNPPHLKRNPPPPPTFGHWSVSTIWFVSEPKEKHQKHCDYKLLCKNPLSGLDRGPTLSGPKDVLLCPVLPWPSPSGQQVSLRSVFGGQRESISCQCNCVLIRSWRPISTSVGFGGFCSSSEEGSRRGCAIL